MSVSDMPVEKLHNVWEEGYKPEERNIYRCGYLRKNARINNINGEYPTTKTNSINKIKVKARGNQMLAKEIIVTGENTRIYLLIVLQRLINILKVSI